MPILVPAELSAWLSERHSDFHDALNGDPSCVLELATMLSDGAERLVEMTGRMLREFHCHQLVQESDEVEFARSARWRARDAATQRLWAIVSIMDSDSEDDRPLVSTSGPEVFAMSDREESMDDDPTTGVGQHSLQFMVEGDSVAPTVVWRHPAIRVRQILCRRGVCSVSCATRCQISSSFTQSFRSIGRQEQLMPRIT